MLQLNLDRVDSDGSLGWDSRAAAPNVQKLESAVPFSYYLKPGQSAPVAQFF